MPNISQNIPMNSLSKTLQLPLTPLEEMIETTKHVTIRSANWGLAYNPKVHKWRTDGAEACEEFLSEVSLLHSNTISNWNNI